MLHNCLTGQRIFLIISPKLTTCTLMVRVDPDKIMCLDFHMKVTKCCWDTVRSCYCMCDNRWPWVRGDKYEYPKVFFRLVTKSLKHVTCILTYFNITVLKVGVGKEKPHLECEIVASKTHFCFCNLHYKMPFKMFLL